MIDPEKIITYLTLRKEALDGFIDNHRKKIGELPDSNHSDSVRVHLESIGKLQARKNECETLVSMIKLNGFKNG